MPDNPAPKKFKTPLKAFICYTRADSKLVEEFKEQVKSLEQDGALQLWGDWDISAGLEWDRRIQDQLEQADVFFALTSAAWNNSSYIETVEIRRALERHAAGECRLIPVMLRNWRPPELLKRLNFLPGLTTAVENARPRTKAWITVIGGIERVIIEMASLADADPKPYLKYLHDDTAFIEIRGLQMSVGEAARFPINDLYIPLIDEMGTRVRVTEKRQLEDLLVQTRLLVILGDPGAGKTTFLRRLVHNASAQRIADPSAPFPLLLRVSELSDFLEQQSNKEAPALLPRFLAQQSRDWLVPLDGHFFERQLAGRPSLLLLDGLDEAPNESAREAVSRLIEKAATRWQTCRFVVTTRPRAYEEEVMLSGFHHARIGALEQQAVQTFLQHWAAALIPENPQRAELHSAELIHAVESRAEIQRIAANPVMLTALAVLHWNEKRMPEQRADLYESILKWLARSRKRRPGRIGADACISILQELAGAMHLHPDGRQVQAPRDWAAQQLAPQFQNDAKRALAFLREEELDSGIIVNRGADLKFWHLTFQEYLAARLLAGFDDADRYRVVFTEGRAWLEEWREAVLLLAGILHQQRATKVDALVRAALDVTMPELLSQARCFGLLGAMLRDLQPLGYRPSDPRLGDLKQAVLDIFKAEYAASIPLSIRFDAAEALGLFGDPRLRLPAHLEYWVRVGNFEIGRYPVTVYEYSLFVKAGGPKPGMWELQLSRCNCPVIWVSWHDAKAYCKWANVRLPTEAEWERAASGVGKREYPWGNEDPDPDRANYNDTKLGKESPVGLFPRGFTPDGIADLAGNVFEWVEDWYDKSQTARVLRGGCWYFNSRVLRSSDRDYDGPGVRGVSIGFRAARD